MGLDRINQLPHDAHSRSSDLRTISFAQLLIELYEADQDGTLLIYGAGDGLRAAVAFEAGRPAAALAEHDARDLQTMLIPLCAWTEGRFEFAPGKDHVKDDGLRAPASIDPLRLITAAARGPLREDVVEQTIVLIGDNAIRLAQRLDVKRYAFSAQEQMVLTALDAAPIDMSELRARVQVSERVLRRVLYVLLLTRAISLLPPTRRMVSGTLFNARALAEGASQPPTAAHSARPSSQPITTSVAPAQSMRPSRPAMPSTVPVRSTSVTPGERPSAKPSRRPPPAAVKSSKHPSLPYAVRAPEHGVNAVTPSLVPEDAPESLTSVPPATSAAPPRNSSIPAPTEARAQREQAEALWQRAEALARRGDYDVALSTARAALKYGNTPPEREALLGWLIYQHGGGGTRIHPHVWKCLNHALQRDPLCEEALYYKGMLLSRSGKIDQAHAHFARILLLNPKHMEATREVRIIEMRRTHEREQSGFLRRLLTGRPASGKTDVPKE